MTIAYYNGGVRVVDISGLDGHLARRDVAQRREGMKEVGYYRTANANSWSAKTPRIDPKTGDFYLYGNDIRARPRHLPLRRRGQPSKSKGRWRTPAETRAMAAARAPTTDGPETSVICLLP